MVLQLPPLKNFTVAFFCKYVCANIIYIYIHYVYLSTCMCIYIYMNVWKYECMYVQNERVCHTISGLKCCIRRTPPTSFGSPKNMWGGVYFMWSGEIFLRNFLPYPPPKYSRVKGGGCLRGPPLAPSGRSAWQKKTAQAVTYPWWITLNVIHNLIARMIEMVDPGEFNQLDVWFFIFIWNL